MPQSTMPQIKKIVFLMLENRSLDNLLGWLYDGRKPDSVYPAGSSPEYDGLVAGKFRQPYSSTQSYEVVPLPAEHRTKAVPAYDPYEEMYEEASWHGVLNQLFGNQNLITNAPQPPTPPRMQGFYQDYYREYMREWQGRDIVWTYTRGQVPVINTLAYNYSVSDAWFCSVPTQTNPNRAFSLIGTSQGNENNLYTDAIEQYVAPTIFNALGDAGKSLGLYYHDLWQAPTGSTIKQCYTQYTFPELTKARPEIAPLEVFFRRASDGTLPEFTYLEPKWGYGTGVYSYQGWDYHPPTRVHRGEIFLDKVFRSLRGNAKQWAETLFIVTFDEHGGTYDHVAPKWGAINPDGRNGTYFRFNLFGARVPTILISPFAYPRRVFRAPPVPGNYPFDHTSFIKTLLQWAGVDLGTVNFGKRMLAAPTFDRVLSPVPVNNYTPDYEPVPEPQPEPGELNHLFEGMPFLVIRNILRRKKTLEEIHAEIARYKRDPEAFEAEELG